MTNGLAAERLFDHLAADANERDLDAYGGLADGSMELHAARLLLFTTAPERIMVSGAPLMLP